MHREASALDGGEFFARVAHRLVHGSATPREAVEAVAADSSAFVKTKVAQALAKVDEALNPDSQLAKEKFVDDRAIPSMARLWEVGKSEPIKVGKASPTEGTLPGAVYFICKYNNLAQAARSNAEVGGDNASRSIPIGMVLGAYEGMEGIPAQLGKGKLVEWEHTEQLLNKLPLLAKSGSANSSRRDL